MKLFIAPLLLIFTTEAFHIPTTTVRSTARLSMVNENHQERGMHLQRLEQLIDEIDQNNYKETLQTIEPLLLQDASPEEYNEAMRHLNRKAHHLGMDIPHDFASDTSHQPPIHLHGGDESMDKTAGSGMLLQHVDLLIEHLDGRNFEASLDTIEPFLINEADETFLKDALQRIESKAGSFGKSIPKNYGEKVNRASPKV